MNRDIDVLFASACVVVEAVLEQVISRTPSLKFPKIHGFQGGLLGFQALFKVFR